MLPTRARLSVKAMDLLMKSDLSFSAWEPLVREAIQHRYGNGTDTTKVVIGHNGRMFRFLRAHQVYALDDVTTDLVVMWCWAGRKDRNGEIRDVHPNTARLRQWSALVWFEEAADRGCPIDPEALIGERIQRLVEAVAARPLDDEEDRLVCRHADTGLVGSRRSLVVAVSRTGASLSEAASLRARDIDLSAGTITLRGDAARTNAMDEWSVQAVEQWSKCLSEQPEPDELVCISKKNTTKKAAAKSMGVRLGSVLAEARIRHRPGVSATSIRLTGARYVFEESGIEAAARFLGAASLDRTAGALRHNWQGDGHA